MQFMSEVRQRAAQLVQENATTILTGIGVVGTVATGVLAAKAGTKAGKILTEEEAIRTVDRDANGPSDFNGPLNRKEKIVLVGGYFVPPIITGTGTIVAIVLGHRLTSQRAAALAAAYGLTQKHFDEYRAKVEEKITGQKKSDIEGELAQERLDKTPGSQQVVIIEGQVLCFDAYSGRYFNSTMETIKQSVNKVNENILNHDYSSLSEFYAFLDLPSTGFSDDVGFNQDNVLEVIYSTRIADNGRPCIVMDFARHPRPDYKHRNY